MTSPVRRRATLFATVLILLPVGMRAQTSASTWSTASSPMGSGTAAAPAATSAAQASPVSGMAETAAPASSQQHLAPLALKPDAAGNVPASVGPATSAPSPLTLHLIVGRSFFLESAEKLRRVYVSNPAVVDAMTASLYEVVITAKLAGTSSLVLWNTAGTPVLYTVLADVDVAGLRESLAQALPGDHVEVAAQEGRIHLTGVVDSDAASDEAAKLAVIYSKDVVNSLVVDPHHLPQVQLQVRIAEINRSS
jgi:pilus assembly protein CpaC